jgi:hypothetical protein
MPCKTDAVVARTIGRTATLSSNCSRMVLGFGHRAFGGHITVPRDPDAAASRSSSKWQNEPKFNFKQLHICFSRKPCRFRDPVAPAFVWRMPDARSVRASATWGGRESAQRLVPVHHSTRQYSLRA